MKRTQQPSDYLTFKQRYEQLSGLSIPNSYFEQSEVYIQKIQHEIVGGYILSSKLPLRSIKYFVSDAKRNAIELQLSKEIFCEVSCFWIDPKYRPKKYLNTKIWLALALAVRRQSKKIIVFGTNSYGLAKLYGYPKVSLLYNRDKINNKTTYLFLVKRKDFLGGVIELLLSKLIYGRRVSNVQCEKQLRNSINYELSK